MIVDLPINELPFIFVGRIKGSKVQPMGRASLRKWNGSMILDLFANVVFLLIQGLLLLFGDMAAVL